MLIIVAGPMFAGKTTWLLNYASRQPVEIFLLFKPHIDTRFAEDKCMTHDGKHLFALNLDAIKPEFPQLSEAIKTILIDELNFFNTDNLMTAIKEQQRLGRNIVGAGLNYDHEKIPFGATIPLTKIADESIQLYSKCDKCGGKAQHVYRKIQNENRIFLGTNKSYGTCCEVCWDYFAP